MRKFLRFFLLLMSFSVMTTGCFEDLFGSEDDEETTGTSTTELAGYNYTFVCPGSTKENTVPIPKGSAKCQKAQEYFARKYGCNDADYFNEANCRVCHDCGWTNYCKVCQ